MAYIILSDIHGNLEAFEAVIKSFPQEQITGIICAGDIVGYGANPIECVDLIKSLNAETVLGNHEAGSIGKTDISNFNEYAREAVLWTKSQLTESCRNYLSTLPLMGQNKFFTFVHGTLHKPEEFRYMMTGDEAMNTFKMLRTKICFLGHSHRPGVFIFRNGKIYYVFKEKIVLDETSRYIINVGSIGQPRDGDARACYAVYYPEKNEIIFKRVEYDVQTARRRIIDAGLPRVLGERLLYGE